LRLTSLSRFTFTDEQSQFILDFLYHNHRGTYNKIMTQNATNTARLPSWWTQSNTKAFRDLLRNGN
jgi:hypothetical protein